jgi:hypothetical protein
MRATDFHLVVFVSRIGHLRESNQRLLEAFRLSSAKSKSTWTNQGVETNDDGEAAFVALSWEHGCDIVASLHGLLAKWPVKRLTVLIHPQGGPDNWQISRLSLEKRAGVIVDTWVQIWPHRIITCSTTHGRVGGAVRMLAQSIWRQDGAEFNGVLQRLRAAVASAMRFPTPETRMSAANDALPKDYESEETSVTFVRHRIAGTMGALLMAIEDWVDDAGAAGIRQFFGRGKAMWNEIEGLLVGGASLSEWQQRTKTLAIVKIVKWDRKDEITKTLKKMLDDAQQLKISLMDLDTKSPTAARAMLTDQQRIDYLRRWTRDLDSYLAVLEAFN